MGLTKTARRFENRLPAVGWLGIAALLTVGLFGRPAFAQETRGRIAGVVTDEATHKPLGGVTVVLQGQQGEDATITDDHGNYEFVNLLIGTYAARFYNATSSSNVVRENLPVTAGGTLRVDAAIPSQAVAQETYVIQKKAAAIDIGSGRLGLTIDQDYMNNLPLDRTFGDLMLKAPGAFLESSGDVSIAGASGLENIYVMDGLNVTGMEYGDIMNKAPNASGGSNLTLDFIKELQVSTGGYRAEFGGAMGGVVNVITKSGSNELHGSAFMYWSPYWMASDPKRITQASGVLSGQDKPDYDTNIGVEVGGPIIKDKLFFWVGFAPRLEKSHYFRDVTPLVGDGSGGAAADQSGAQTVLRTRTNELRQSYQYGAKIDFIPAPDQKLTLSIFGTPSTSKHVHSLSPGEEADANPMWALESVQKTNTDIMAAYMAQFLDRHLRLDASAGLHRETYNDTSPYSSLNSLNMIEVHGGSLYDYEPIAGCAPVTTSGGVFDPCPVGGNSSGYHTGGFGQEKTFTGNRWMGDAKLTALLPKNEVKIGAHAELNTFDQTRYYSGPLDQRELLQIYPGAGGAVYPWTFFTLPKGTYPSQFDPSLGGNPLLLADPNGPYYKNALVADVKSVNTAYFVQDTYHPLTNLTIDLGLRYENQRMYDFRDTEFMNVDNWGPRVGVVFDPTNDGRSKIFANAGRFYETVPMNLAARYFGGEGIVVPVYDPTACNPPVSQWQGTGNEFKGCGAPGGAQFVNAGAPYPVQANLHGQYHNEIVAGGQRALTDDLVVGLSYTHRWLGEIIEDGSADPNFQSVLANPGNVPQSALDAVQNNINAETRVLQATADAGGKAQVQAQIDNLNTELKALKMLGQEPKPERTYDALTLTATKRLAKRWLFQGSYTYSRLFGNYNGLYDADASYFAPNGTNAYDTPDLVLNKRGPLANDRPHSGHVDAAYQIPTPAGTVTIGLSYSAYSGVPRNYVAALFSGQQLVFLLPRGAAGRTPTVQQADFKVSYRRELTKTTAIEAFFNLFNILDSRTTLLQDDNYTFDAAAPIVNGNANDLKYAKNAAGLPIQKNPNFGQPLAFQSPFHGQMGLRFIF